jgi:ADP-ribose pyrophosphatase YjhB (NUDIX family)
MIKGIDFTGITVSFYCHDGQGNYVFHKRSDTCRDEHGRWDCGGGGLKFGERLIDAVHREVEEEYGTNPKEVEFLGTDEIHREHDGKPTHWISFRYRVLVDREKVINNEPDKHSDLGWFTLDTVPTPRHSQLDGELEKYKEFLK